MAYLSLQNIKKIFGAATAVDNFNLDIEKGEFVTFLGPSGCGKTTTLRMVAGFETQTSGNIILNGEDISNRPPNKRNMGMVFQSYALFPNMTIADNIGFGLKIANRPKEEIATRVQEMLNLIHLPAYGKRYPFQLSGGQQQRVALARALAARPQMLLLDEPLSALDAKIRLDLRTEIRAIQRELGITTIYVTHDQEEALSISDRVVVMKDGHIEQIGTPFEIYNFPQTAFTASFIGTLNVLKAVVKDPAAGLLEFEGQVIQTASPLGEKRKGDNVTVALRPEGLSLQEAENPELNHLNGKIENIFFLGAVVRFQIRIGETLVLLDTFNHPHLEVPALGTAVQVGFPHQACLVLTHGKD
ncbi:MAG TPA: ABC transporter ATP-binding protein [Anaerolineaceae bacterium]|nr:ABC transporter ATP-binding protein [Anaerolineaceae bacterium]HPN54260.1 ABC transporter ATP-binding protein [Anaerolineaceae bacterium]